MENGSTSYRYEDRERKKENRVHSSLLAMDGPNANANFLRIASTDADFRMAPPFVPRSKYTP